MKIAQVVNIWQSIPPSGYGGTESVVYNLCEGLVKKGHEVTLFASGDSQTHAKLISFFEKKLMGRNIPWNNYLYSLNHFLNSYETIKQSNDFDIIHGHYSVASDLISLGLANIQDIPSVFTLHTTLPTQEKYNDRKVLFESAKKINYVSISNNQRQINLNYSATIYHGLDMGQFPYQDRENHNDMLWLGRVVPEKGIEYALDLASQLKINLIAVGRIDKESPANLAYFNSTIKHKLTNPYVTWKEEVDSNERNKLMLASKCFLFPIQWEEPFGLVMIESMVCGTPVIAFAQGSVPEVIKDGETGFIVNVSGADVRGNFIIKKTGIEGLREAVQRIYAMPEDQYKKMRKACREHVEKNFTVEHMIHEYEKVYQEIISKHKS